MDIMGALAAAINGGMQGYQWGQKIQDNQNELDNKKALQDRATQDWNSANDAATAKNKAAFEALQGYDQRRGADARQDASAVGSAMDSVAPTAPSDPTGAATPALAAVQAALTKAGNPTPRTYDPSNDYSTAAQYAAQGFNLDHVTRRDNLADTRADQQTQREQDNVDKQLRIESQKAAALQASPGQLAQSAKAEGATPEEVASITAGGQNAIHVYTATMQAISARKAEAGQNARHAQVMGATNNANLRALGTDLRIQGEDLYRQVPKTRQLVAQPTLQTGDPNPFFRPAEGAAFAADSASKMDTYRANQTRLSDVLGQIGAPTSGGPAPAARAIVTGRVPLPAATRTSAPQPNASATPSAAASPAATSSAKPPADPTRMANALKFLADPNTAPKLRDIAKAYVDTHQ